MDLNQITKPTLLLDETIAKANIARMCAKAGRSGVILRPHFKTHFSAQVADWYRSQGITCCTCSSIDMAMYFANHGWEDITIAFPVNVRQIDDLNELAQRITLNLVVESQETVEILNEQLTTSANMLIKIDTGYRRTGVWHENVEEILSIINSISATHKFKGLLAHFGHTYKERDHDSIRKIYEAEVNSLLMLKSKLELSDCYLSIGDTPSCSVVAQFDQVDEIRPGNFIFYDLMQTQISSCSQKDIAVCLAVPIVAIHPKRNELVVHGGGVHLSKDRIVLKGKEIFGKAVFLNESGWSHPEFEMLVTSLSQEHGKIEIGDNDLHKFKVGDLIGVLPIHSCLSANLMKSYLTTNGQLITTMHA